ncbi:MAG: hypothetical protein L3J16_00530 [Anaerolineales bacterium]|nr:hypothetical protein [Anaerolineales bacterium]
MAKKRKTSRSRRTAAVAPRSAEFDPDYTEIKNDLKRIGMMAGGFVLVLVVLSFFLN